MLESLHIEQNLLETDLMVEDGVKYINNLITADLIDVTVFWHIMRIQV